MTQKDYIKIAEGLRGVRDDYLKSAAALAAIDDITRGLCVVLSHDSPRFDYDKFVSAAGLGQGKPNV